jgi:hypothetical protein
LAKARRRHESEDAMTQLRPTMQNRPLTAGGVLADSDEAKI